MLYIMKLGRNEPCWCGSGKKFKKCHLNRHIQEKIKPWESIQNIKKAFGSKYCSVPDNLKGECKGDIVKAHTVSKSTNLKKIERDGHVYGFIPSFENLTKNNGILQPELLGINKASTFTGFCAHHDKIIFSPLEDKEFEASKEQCFLLCYRAHAREYFTKNGAANLLDFMKESDRGKGFSEQIAIQSFVSNYTTGVKAGVRDNKIYKSILDDILITKDFSSIKAYIINFKKIPSVFCSAGIFPEFDFYGNRLQDLSDLSTTPDFLTFSTIARKTGGSVVFCWVNHSHSKGSCEKFIESLKIIDASNITSSILRFFFEFCENVFMEPTWWELLEKSKKESLLKRFVNAASIFVERKSNCLCNDNRILDDWIFSSTKELK